MEIFHLKDLRDTETESIVTLYCNVLGIDNVMPEVLVDGPSDTHAPPYIQTASRQYFRNRFAAQLITENNNL